MRMGARARFPGRPLPVLLRALAPALVTVLAMVLAVSGCDRSQAPARSTASPAPQAAPAGGRDAFARPPAADPSADAPVVLFLGDSLTAGYGLPVEAAYPSLIQARLRKAGYAWRVVNAGVSGDTSAGALSRLDWLLKQRVDVMVVALGGNDGLRGQDPEAMRANLAKIIERAQARGIQVVLAGMQMPANYGADYTRRFKQVFPQLAEHYNIPLIPFLLDGVAMRPELNQADGIHPDAQGARLVADNVWRVLKPVLDKLAAGRG
jgi:acyl-CoA thioesterase I